MSQPSFRDAVASYEAYLQARSTAMTKTRVEVHVECQSDWSRVGTLTDLEQWFLEQRESAPMTVEDIPLNETRGWSIDRDTGNIAHHSGDFFTIHGLRVKESFGREVGSAGWDQPIVEQVGYDGGLLGLLRQRIDGVPHYLIEAKSEPGNYKVVQLSPTLQATFANLRKAHRGERPKFAEYFETPDESEVTVLYDQWLSEDGGRLHLKRNRGMLVEVDVARQIDVPEGYRWVSMWQIKELLNRDAWVNPHIRGIIAHL